jgi:tripartite-type tricarboxylate transporter receptor subunit TctC
MIAKRAILLAVLAIAVSTAQPIVSTTAQTYPTRPITMLVPYPAGGIVDTVGRILAERMRVSLGQPIIIENISGADGSIGTDRAARAKPDGYTINLGTMDTHVLNGAFYSLPYDVLSDFTPISPLVTSSWVLFARKAMPASDLQELVTWLRVNPNKASAGIIGAVGSHVLFAFFQKQTGTRFTLVPYRGAAPAMQDVVAGQIDLTFAGAGWLPLMRSGSIKAYAVTSDTRTALARDLPTFAEMGLPALSHSNWYGLFAPKGTPQDIIGKLNATVAEALADPSVRSRAIDGGLEIFPRERQTAEALAALQKADAEKWWPIIRELGLKSQGGPGGP